MKEADYSFNELIHNESFQKWVNGEATPQQKRYWDHWMMSSSDNRALAIRAQKHVSGFTIKPSSQPAQQEGWNRMSRKMDSSHHTSSESYSYRSSKTNTTKWFFRVAAGFILVAITSVAVHFYTGSTADKKQNDPLVRKEVATEYGEQKVVLLGDGSKITLNAHSNLVYTINPADFNAVEVHLEGEAQFSIAKRKKPSDLPFKVRTSAGLVKVMGTKFVVSTRSDNTQVVLEEGRVALHPLNKKEDLIMKPGQLAEFNSNSDTIRTTSVNPKVYSSWTTNALVFDHTPFAEIAVRLEDTFGIKVVLRESQLYKRKISGSIDNSSLKVITSALSDALNTPIRVTENTIYVGKKRFQQNSSTPN